MSLDGYLIIHPQRLNRWPTIAMRPTLLYIISQGAIPAKARLGEAWAGIHL